MLVLGKVHDMITYELSINNELLLRFLVKKSSTNISQSKAEGLSSHSSF